MFSWITGPRITNVIEDLQSEPAYESTFIEAPETPAHQFAVKAFKHAIFGTPAPEDANNASKRLEKKAKLEAANSKSVQLPAPREKAPLLSPSKQPGGILMTPGTASKGRKTVSFGSQVMDNQGKPINPGKSGIPDDCPGKFPSPWTPGIGLKLDPESDKRPRTKLTEALLDARTTTQPKSGQKPKARDDSDITIDLGAPRSESGKYWKEQYESYAERSEKEMKKVIAKQQLAKKFAMKKDCEVTELSTKLEQERKRFRQRERELEQQNKDYQERLRQAMAENTSASVEVSALKSRIAALEKSTTAPLSEVQQSKPSFEIFEDLNRDAMRLQREKGVEVSHASSGKENSSPRLRRRQTLTETSSRPNGPSRLGTAQDEASIILGKSPRAPVENAGTTTKQTVAPPTSEQTSKSPLRIRRPDPSQQSFLPQSPVAVLPSSPLPMPSPDPWMEMDESSIPQMDKMAMPISSGQPYTRAAWNPPPKKNRPVKSVSQAAKPAPKADRRDEKPTSAGTKVEIPTAHAKDTARKPEEPSVERPRPSKDQSSARSKTTESTAHQAPADERFNVSKITSHHAEGSAQVKQDRAEMLPVDRKEQARRRLEERKKLRKHGAA
ncbi:hypothetical protein P153DRAFT_293582 [Dothidotthia symphoricarpi CBS 119687]|uniref:Spindle pole body-associated protein cut12 domain-containing protein n=1 Tax=Dothidotthia symphoricarpi CBS 119687 TaxID=1392245 RepID=A0A6A6A9G2_9PLEO|nr:uncharacterized protein P153DRAFT_293582 [Dothidotthia symphoricarpi CBS 119687]KAF2128450.1 hypothetical protein P153DRAFT_293582 [Dothidotthia symphoricarpi CBS 119687]